MRRSAEVADGVQYVPSYAYRAAKPHHPSSFPRISFASVSAPSQKYSLRPCIQDGFFFSVRETRQVEPMSSLLNDHCGHGLARGLNRASLKTDRLYLN